MGMESTITIEVGPRDGTTVALHSGGRAKAADLLSGLGAIVLGAGLALVAPAWLRSYGIPTLIVGLLVHGTGMSLKYRFESRQKEPLCWERLLFWSCWACLAALGVWIAVGAAGRP
jgi:uncharacterized membrane-anchored protein